VKLEISAKCYLMLNSNTIMTFNSTKQKIIALQES